jgi:hypothetical protein
MVRRDGHVEKAYLATHTPAVVNDVNAMNVDVNIYPNPTSGLVNIDIINHSTDKIEIQFENLLGQKMLSVPAREHKTQVDISNLPGGIYIVNCYLNGLNIHSGRVIKN